MRIRPWLCLLCLLVACGDGKASPAQVGDAGTPHVDEGDAVRSITAEACFETLSEPSQGWLEVQRFRSADGKVKMWRARQTTDGPTVGETSAYALVRLWVEAEGDASTCISSASALSYMYAHHNWDETYAARAGDVTYAASEEFVAEAEADRWKDTVSAQNSDGEVLWGPIDLEDDGCSSLPYNLNPCSSRTRVDQPPPGWGEE